MAHVPHQRGFLSEEEKKEAPKFSWEFLGRILGYVTPYWGAMAVALMAIFGSSFLSLYPAVLTGRIIDEGLIGRDFALLCKLILMSLGVLLGSNLLKLLVAYINIWVAQRVTCDMRNAMYRHLQQMSVRFFTTNRQGDIITRMTSDIDGIQRVIVQTYSNSISNIMVVIIALVAMFRKNWMMALLGMVIVPLFAIVTKKASCRRYNFTMKAHACEDELNQIYNETMSVSGQLLVKLYGAEDRDFEKYKDVNEKLVNLNIKESMAGRVTLTLLMTFTSIGPMLIYLLGGALMIVYGNQNLSVGDITVMVALLERMYRPMDQLMNLQVEFTRSMALFSRIFQYFDLPVEIQNLENALIPEGIGGTLSFEHVDFSYEEGKEILKDINLEIPDHGCIALVGGSGAGKSTLVNLIPRLYDTSQGTVKLGGHDVRNLDLAFLRSQIGMVTQETYLFNSTIRENLLFAKPDATQEELEDACKKAHIHEFIMAQPDGYDSLVGNRGLKLSGGEKQRISIARVILKNPRILIFDEATSSLDSISEYAIQEAINPLLHERTSIVIAHRLSTIMEADEIVVLNHGEIVERGGHKELVHAGGLYTELYETQFKAAL